MDILAKFEQKPKAVSRRGPLVLKVKSKQTSVPPPPSAAQEATPAAAESPKVGTPAPQAPASQAPALPPPQSPLAKTPESDETELVIEKAPQAAFDIQAFLGDFVPQKPPVSEKVSEVVEPTEAEGSAAPAPEPEPEPAAAPAPAPKTKQRKRKVVVYSSAEEARAAVEAEKAEKAAKKAAAKVPRKKRAMTSQKKAKLVTAVAMLDEIKSHGMPGSRNPPPRLLASEYYLNNRQGFVSAIAKLFDPLRRELAKQKPPSCDDRVGTFGLLPQQEIVINYLNNYTPYRGLLLSQNPKHTQHLSLIHI